MAFLVASSASQIVLVLVVVLVLGLWCLVIEKAVACGAVLSLEHFAGMQPPSNSFFSIFTRARPVGYS